jgi:membrane fusion protein
VAEGEQVQAGQVLFTLDTDRSFVGNAAGTSPQLAAVLGQHIAQRQQSLQAEFTLRALQQRQRADALAQREASLLAELRQVQAEHELMAQRTRLAEKSLARQQELAQSGFVSEAQTQSKAEELLELQARQRSAERNRTALERERASLQAERTSLSLALQTEQEQLKRSSAALDQEATEALSRQQLVVKAAQAGQITALHVKPGQALLPGQALATLVPTQGQQLQAHLYAPSKSAGFVAPGQTVLLRYAAYPYQKFGMHEGQVAQVSKTPIHPQDLPSGNAQALLASAQSNEPLYRITVDLQRQSITAYGESQTLKPGTALEADVLQDERKIWEWVMEPVLAVRMSRASKTIEIK